MNSKGNLFDWFYIIMILFLTGICVFTGYIILHNTQIQKLWVDEGVTGTTEHAEQAINSFDNIMMFVIVGLSLFVLVSSAVVFTHVAFFVIGIILLGIAVVFAAIMSNAFWTFSNDALIATAAAAFPKMVFLIEHLPVYIAFMGIACSVAAYVGYRVQ